MSSSAAFPVPRPAVWLVLAAVAAAVAGCSGGGGTRAPVVSSGSQGTAQGSYVVQRGDTIYGVARRFDLSVRALIDANHLQPPFQLTPGQVLVLSTTADYTVVRGDTLLGVARKTHVPFATLARINNLSPPYVLKIGQRLALPGANAAATATAATTGGGGVTVIQSPHLAAGAPASTAPSASVSASASEAETIPPPPTPPAAKTAYTPLAERSAATTASASQPAAAASQPAAAPATQSAPATPPPPPPVQASTPPTETAPADKAEAPAAASAQTAQLATPLPPPPPKSGRGYVWPAKGPLLAEFGSTGKGQHNDGINIEVPKGTPVLAAEDGVVAYSGNELRGFGNLLLIKHADGWMTAYAHNDKLLVKRGAIVKRGQQVALSGDSGGVSQPQLHFEVRHGTRAVDPLTVLGRRSIPAASPDDPPDPG